MTEWKIVQTVVLVRADDAESVHSGYAQMTVHDESLGGWVETRDLTVDERQDFSEVIDDAETEED